MNANVLNASVLNANVMNANVMNASVLNASVMNAGALTRYAAFSPAGHPSLIRRVFARSELTSAARRRIKIRPRLQ